MSRDAISSTAEKPRVLVVDDSRLMRTAIHKFIQGEFQATEAEDGERGWEMLVGDDHIQVVIADVLMPRLDGYALICRIRAADEARIRDVPVIVITGAEDDETRERAFACGANEFSGFSSAPASRPGSIRRAANWRTRRRPLTNRRASIR
jgi:PleD family two-component response regulator